MSPRLIVTADDFGADLAVNEAIERGHREGILTAASLMVASPARDDAIERARKLPGLGVGLHLVLVDGAPLLPPDRVPDLVDRDGRFRANMAAAGAAFFFRPSVRRQLEAEIAAQFESFAATGLALDHVNAHKHFHVHPTIAALIVKHGHAHGLSAARAPIEPAALLNAIEPVESTFADRLVGIWGARIARRFRRGGLMVPDRVFGLRWTGAMTATRVAALIAQLPDGVSELYLHPAMRDDWPGAAPGYRYADELAALTDARVRDEVARRGIRLGRFADFAGESV